MRPAEAVSILLVVLLAVALETARAATPEMIDRIKPSIVAIGTFQKTRSPPFIFRGTGFAVADGTIVATNAHVVPEKLNAESRESLIALTFGRGAAQPRDARVVAIDAGHDVALIRITGEAVPALDLSDGATVREGQLYAFTGFPIGNVLGFAPVTHRAMISSITPIAIPTMNARQLDVKVIRQLDAGPFPVFQLAATAYPGNSGSPLYDVDTGQVVGIINMVFVKSTKESALTQPSGISFAIPARYLRDLVSRTR